MSFVRDMFQVPRAISRKIYVRFGVELYARFCLMLDDYADWWDEYRTGEGFPVDDYPIELLGYFDAVVGRIDTASANYFQKKDDYDEFCLGQSERAKIGVEKKVKKRTKRIKEKSRYDEKKDEKNRKRREKYALDKKTGVLKKNDENFCNDENLADDCAQRLGDKGFAENSAREKQTKTAESENVKGFEGDFVIDENLQMKDENQKKVYENLADDCTQELTGKEFPSISAKDTDSTTSLRSVVLITGKGGVGGNQVIHNEAVGKSAPSSGLRGSTRPSVGSEGSRAVGSGRGGNVAVSGLPRQASPPHNDSTRQAGSRRPAAVLGKNVVSPALERQTVYGDTWIKIGDDFELDLMDPMFAPYDRMRSRFKKKFESWMIDEFFGRKIDKIFICRQIQASAIRMKELKHMLGEEN